MKAKCCNKNYPGEMVHMDIKSRTREHLFIGVDDFSRKLYASIYPSTTCSEAVSIHHRAISIRIMDASIKSH